MVSPSEQIRRSGRKRTVNTKYINDAFDKDIVRLLRESSESSDPTSPASSNEHTKDPDDEFDVAQVEVGPSPAASHTENDDLSSRSDSDQDASDDSQIRTPGQSEEDNISIATTGISNRQDCERENQRIGGQPNGKSSNETHSRGLLEASRKGPKDRAYHDVFGPTDEEVTPIKLSSDKWTRGSDITFPSRTTLTSLVADGVFGKYVRYGVPEKTLRKEAVAGWQWYRDSKGVRFRERQVVDEDMEANSQERYLPLPFQEDHALLGGPLGKQHTYSIKQQQSISLGEPWPVPEKLPRKGIKVTLSESDSQSRPTSRNHHEGWLLNVGQKANCVAWAPASKGVPTQYLAVACASTVEQRRAATSDVRNRAPEFTSLPPYPSSVQIWAIEPLTAPEDHYARLDIVAAPRLVQVLCMDCGEILRLSWNLSLREDHVEQAAQSDHVSLGLLALVNSDGNARVLDVSVLLDPAAALQYTHVKEPAFIATPSKDTVFTTVLWASPTDLLLGTSSGLLEVYNILSPSQSNTSNAKPDFAHQLQSTYLLDLKPAYPSPLPTFVASFSAAGDLKLTDLRNPTQDNVLLHRSRLPSPSLVYSPLTSAWIVAINNTGNNDAKSTTQPNIVCHSLRRFHNSVNIAKLPEGGLITSLAASRWHPCILAGTSGGIVFGTNFLRKFLPHRAPTDESGNQGWLQKLCHHDWIPATAPFSDPLKPEAETNAIFHGRDTRPGTSRFYEGFKPEKVDLTQPSHKAGQGKRMANQVVTSAQTVFEEEQAVTAMDWSPNLRCAGWAAIAFGSGLVRVQDLAWGDN